MMTEQPPPIPEQLQPPAYTKLGDIAARFMAPVKNATAAYILDAKLRTPVWEQTPEVLDVAMRSIFAGMPGDAGEHLRAHFEVEPDEQRIAASPDPEVNPTALEAVALYGERVILAAVEHQRPLSIDALLTSDDLEAIVATLGEAVPGLDRWQLEPAARHIHTQLVQLLTTD